MGCKGSRVRIPPRRPETASRWTARFTGFFCSCQAQPRAGASAIVMTPAPPASATARHAKVQQQANPSSTTLAAFAPPLRRLLLGLTLVGLLPLAALMAVSIYTAHQAQQ